ncbi:MAG: sulfur carrier protein ThiS [Chitinivibrionales bacterium]|nr:sulfur carrier protein ThiS [Chitinivibrionales bacterium]
MELKVNGEAKSVSADPLSISDLLKLFKVEMPDMVSVQLNGTFVDRPTFGVTLIKDKDEIDFLYYMGGGQ